MAGRRRRDQARAGIEGLSIADFLFLDAAYYLTYNVDQPRPDALVVSCEGCRGTYLPLGPTAGAAQ